MELKDTNREGGAEFVVCRVSIVDVVRSSPASKRSVLAVYQRSSEYVHTFHTFIYYVQYVSYVEYSRNTYIRMY